jgi:hypothetical protein
MKSDNRKQLKGRKEEEEEEEEERNLTLNGYSVEY